MLGIFDIVLASGVYFGMYLCHDVALIMCNIRVLAVSRNNRFQLKIRYSVISFILSIENEVGRRLTAAICSATTCCR